MTAMTEITSSRDERHLVGEVTRWFLLTGNRLLVSLVPLAILGAYILHVATIARRTAAFGPFVPETDRRSSDDET